MIRFPSNSVYAYLYYVFFSFAFRSSIVVESLCTYTTTASMQFDIIHFLRLTETSIIILTALEGHAMLLTNNDGNSLVVSWPDIIQISR